MCRRSDMDPIVRLLTDRYRLNILRVPRAGISIGGLLVDDSGDLRHMGEFSKFFDPPLELPIADCEPLAPVSAAASKAISVNVAANPMAAFLTALGLSGITSLSAKFQAVRHLNISFQISGATLESIDVVELGNELAGRVLRTDNALYREDRKFFVVHSVAKATGLNLGFQAKGNTGAELAADIVQVAKASGSVTVKQTSAAQISVTGSTPLVFGLAVLRLTQEPGQLKLDLPANLQPVRRRARAAEGTAEEVPSVLFGDPEGEFLIDVGEPE
jgi:hypothetical protein